MPTEATATEPPPELPRPQREHRPHRVLVAGLFVVAVLAGFVAMFSVWANRQALNTDNWTTTSARLLADDKVQTALSAYLVNQVFRSVDVKSELQAALPPRAAGAAGPLAAGLEQVANRAVPALLATSAVQQAWRQANRAAHRQLIAILNGGSKAVSTTNGEVVLNLHPLGDSLASQLGVASQVQSARSALSGSTGAKVQQTAQQKLGVTIPATSGEIKILRSTQLKTAQDIGSAIKGLAILATAITFLLFAAAVWFARGWRRRALRTSGWCLIGLGLAVLFARRLAGNYLVSHLVANESNRPAMHDVWNIGTSLLYDIAAAILVYGIVVVAAAWLAGQTRTAMTGRLWLAPRLRDRTSTVYAVMGVAFLLLLIWGPTPAFRQAIPILLIAALLILGVEVLRRQTAAEFPHAQPGDASRSVQAWRAARRPAAAGPSAGNASPATATREELALMSGRQPPTSSD